MRQIKHGSTTATAAAALNITGTQQASNIVFKLASLSGGETIAVTGVYRTTSGSKVQTAAIKPIDLATGAVPASAALPNGDYQLLDWNFEEIIFTKSAGVNTVVITWRLFEDE